MKGCNALHDREGSRYEEGEFATARNTTCLGLLAGGHIRAWMTSCVIIPDLLKIP